MLLPIRWMSPESIMYRKYTIESDCWSFGILLWEVITYGKQPWYEYNNSQVIQNITRGKHLKMPLRCPQPLYELMTSCWHFKPTDRITIGEVHKQIKNLLEKYKEHPYEPDSNVNNLEFDSDEDSSENGDVPGDFFKNTSMDLENEMSILVHEQTNNSLSDMSTTMKVPIGTTEQSVK